MGYGAEASDRLPGRGRESAVGRRRSRVLNRVVAAFSRWRDPPARPARFVGRLLRDSLGAPPGSEPRRDRDRGGPSNEDVGCRRMRSSPGVGTWFEARSRPWGTAAHPARSKSAGPSAPHRADDGPGMTPEVREHAFDLYFTTREDGGGVGLPLVRQSLERHNGTVEIRSEVGKGTEVILVLPRLRSAGTAARPAPPYSTKARGRSTICGGDRARGLSGKRMRHGRLVESARRPLRGVVLAPPLLLARREVVRTDRQRRRPTSLPTPSGLPPSRRNAAPPRPRPRSPKKEGCRAVNRAPGLRRFRRRRGSPQPIPDRGGRQPDQSRKSADGRRSSSPPWAPAKQPLLLCSEDFPGAIGLARKANFSRKG
jgi:hypothetical protein